MAVNDLIEVQTHFLVGSQPTMMVTHFRETVAIDAGSFQLASAAVIEALAGGTYMDNMMAFLSVGCRVVSMRAQRIAPAAGIPTLFVFGAAEAIEGVRTGELIPPQAALLISLYTSLATRSGRGRMYIPGISEGDQEDGLLTETAFDLIQPFLNDILDDIVMTGDATGTIRQVVYSRTLGTNNLIEMPTAHPNLATIRGRRARPGFAS